MPAYRFEAIDAQGKPRTGLLEGDNPRAVRTQLRAQGLVPIGVEGVAAGLDGGRQARFTRRTFSTTSLAVWTRQLAGLVAAGLPLERALTALSEEAEEPRQRDLVAHLRAEVNAGSTFARALASAPREFDDVFRAVVAAGEQSGALGTVLERLADDLEERQALRAKLLGAALYPAIVSVIALVIVMPLLTVYTDVTGVLGGMVMAKLKLGVGFDAFVDRLDEAIQLSSYWTGLAKAPVFALIVALVGCHRGFQVRGSADSVGAQTTTSVVQAIFLVIVTDALFSIVFLWLDL